VEILQSLLTNDLVSMT